MWNDLRQGIRVLVQHPGFACLAALVLALGIGLNSAIFSIVYAMLFKPVAVSQPEEIVYLYQVLPRQPGRPFVMPSDYYEFFKRHSDAFTGMTAHWGIPYALRADGETDRVEVEWVFANYFEVLGVKPALGRALLPDEDNGANTGRAVVISHSLWTRRFDADPAIIGRQVYLARWQQPESLWTIVGVTGPEFKGLSSPWTPTDAWITFAQAVNPEEGRQRFSVGPIARLKPGVSLRQARAMIVAQGHEAYRYGSPGANPEYEPRFVVHAANDTRMPFDPSAALIPARLAGAMMIVVAMVLLVAATNIAGILMARGVGRTGEIAVRRVLGAGTLRIVRQLLIESVLLAFAGGVAGFVLSAWLLSLFRAFTPVQFAFDVTMDGRIVVFTIAVCTVAGIAVGVLPARQAARVDVLPWLTGGSVVTRQSSRRIRHAITVPQVAVSLALLLVAGVYVRALLAVELANVGYRPANLLVVQPVLKAVSSRHADATPAAAQQAERARRFHRQLLDRLHAIPGAADVAIGSSLPVRAPQGRPNWSAVAQEAFATGDRDGAGTERVSVSHGYFRTMGMRMLSGRDFDERDTAASPKVAIVSSTIAQLLWPGRDPVGRTLTLMNAYPSKGEDHEWYQVIGVVNEVSPILQSDARPLVYLHLGQEWSPSSNYVLARGAGDSRTLIPAVKDAIAGADPMADTYRVSTMAQLVAELLYPRRIAGAILAVSGLLGMLLATIGVYGVVSYALAQRSGEIGVRMALGAERRDIVRLILHEGLMVSALGSIGGLALGYTAIRTTSSGYLALPTLDVTTMIVTPLVLGTVVLAACYVPARRAARIEPMDALRRS